MEKKEAITKDLTKSEEQKIHILDGSAETVGELIDLLSTIPKYYKVSLSGMNSFAIAVDDIDKAICIDDVNWIEELVYELNEMNEECDEECNEECGDEMNEGCNEEYGEVCNKESRDIIKMTGRLLCFDKPDAIGCYFPKNCDITFPEKVPVVREFRHYDPTAVLGSATVTKDERGLVCDVCIFANIDRDTLREYFHDELFIGGYYTGIKTHSENGVQIVDKASLKAIGTTFGPVDPELKMVVKEG